jgi:23S rRNA (cytidine1920-2'-O)/16S rRNA (cytidine1409-2'-O)-methyltransferase
VIHDGQVLVKGMRVTKPATLVASDVSIALAADPPRFVSRGGDKLDGALAAFDIVVAGRRWLDAGASTGGFTDRLLQGGAREVVAVDVGYGQLDWRLRNDRRVRVWERVNVRDLRPEALPWAPDGIVADLSFISLRLVLPALARIAHPDADLVLLVKPQFEVGRESVGKGGVVGDPALWRRALDEVAAAGEALAWGVAGAVRSPLVGPAGNVEFFLHLRRRGPMDDTAIARAVEDAS